MDIQLITKMKILKPVNEVFEAFVDPAKIGKFWFSSSSERWEQGKVISLRYDEYNALVDITIMEIEVNKKIVFQWGEGDEKRIVTITMRELNNTGTIIEVNETGWKENEELINSLLGNKEGWVYMLTCLKGYLENGIYSLRAGIVI